MCVCVVCVYKMEYYLAINEILPLAAKKKKAEIPSVGKEGCKATGTFIRCWWENHYGIAILVKFGSMMVNFLCQTG